ncbi:MAG: hypothetical protein V7670_09155 [Maribacter arcticus]|uniref:hypothetical protein n=1 Tax=Maribacter arcticus TaxID=561365 RepID=UPI003003983E
MKNLVLAIVLVMSFNTNGQSERGMLLIGFTSAPPFIIENGENLEGLVYGYGNVLRMI